MEEIFWILIPLAAFMIPITAIWTAHQRKMIELRLQLGQGENFNVTEELRQMKNQISELRDTTTRYDMSFDSALQRIESRVGNLETRVTSVERTEGSAQPTGQRTSA